MYTTKNNPVAGQEKFYVRIELNGKYFDKVCFYAKDTTEAEEKAKAMVFKAMKCTFITKDEFNNL